MNKLFTKIFEDFFPPEKPLEPGIFQNTILIDQRPQKVQLRIEENGSGLLVINARTILHLNQTATEFGYALLNADDENKIIANASKRYKVDKNQFRQDFLDFKNK
ncbi:MAG: hypothetical protein HGA53_05605, partial [Anaerolineaceae bacterium]|nr:hypothetical protein [Anaerolineaceae bacterium]